MNCLAAATIPDLWRATVGSAGADATLADLRAAISTLRELADREEPSLQRRPQLLGALGQLEHTLETEGPLSEATRGLASEVAAAFMGTAVLEKVRAEWEQGRRDPPGG